MGGSDEQVDGFRGMEKSVTERLLSLLLSSPLLSRLLPLFLARSRVHPPDFFTFTFVVRGPLCCVFREQVLELPAAAKPLRFSQAGKGQRGWWIHAPVVREGEAGAAQPGPERLLSRGERAFRRPEVRRCSRQKEEAGKRRRKRAFCCVQRRCRPWGMSRVRPCFACAFFDFGARLASSYPPSSRV